MHRYIFQPCPRLNPKHLPIVGAAACFPVLMSRRQRGNSSIPPFTSITGALDGERQGAPLMSEPAAYCAQGFYVLVDFHAAPGDTTVSSGNFVSDWQTLWRAVAALPTFASDLAGRIFLDLYNEPDGIGLRQDRQAPAPSP